MFGSQKYCARRAAIHESRPDSLSIWWGNFRSSGGLASVGIAAIFCILAIAILMLREQVLPYRVGQTVSYDIISRADFTFPDRGLLEEKQLEAREHTPRIYKSNVDKITGDSWQPLQDELLSLPDKVVGLTLDQLPPQLGDVLDGGSLTALQQYQSKGQRQRYAD